MNHELQPSTVSPTDTHPKKSKVAGVSRPTWWGAARRGTIHFTTHARAPETTMLAHLVLLLAASSLAEDFAPPAGYEVVTTEGKASLGAEKTCGEDTTEGRKICVSYNLCDPKTGTIDRSGKYDGHLVIDIRWVGS